jgi:protein-S-isoprenylcysteine O-methyltransferase Ste14
MGFMIFVAGLVFMLPAFVIKPINAPHGDMNLKTTGFYRLTRNPIYFGEVLWCLGWAIIHRSVIGICLVPLWWLGLLFHIFIEEESLERELGQNYLEYKKRIRGRIIPGLPI